MKSSGIKTKDPNGEMKWYDIYSIHNHKAQEERVESIYKIDINQIDSENKLKDTFNKVYCSVFTNDAIKRLKEHEEKLVSINGCTGKSKEYIHKTVDMLKKVDSFYDDVTILSFMSLGLFNCEKRIWKEMDQLDIERNNRNNNKWKKHQYYYKDEKKIYDRCKISGYMSTYEKKKKYSYGNSICPEKPSEFYLLGDKAIEKEKYSSEYYYLPSWAYNFGSILYYKKNRECVRSYADRITNSIDDHLNIYTYEKIDALYAKLQEKGCYLEDACLAELTLNHGFACHIYLLYIYEMFAHSWRRIHSVDDFKQVQDCIVYLAEIDGIVLKNQIAELLIDYINTNPRDNNGQQDIFIEEVLDFLKFITPLIHDLVMDLSIINCEYYVRNGIILNSKDPISGKMNDKDFQYEIWNGIKDDVMVIYKKYCLKYINSCREVYGYIGCIDWDIYSGGQLGNKYEIPKTINQNSTEQEIEDFYDNIRKDVFLNSMQRREIIKEHNKEFSKGLRLVSYTHNLDFLKYLDEELYPPEIVDHYVPDRINNAITFSCLISLVLRVHVERMYGDPKAEIRRIISGAVQYLFKQKIKASESNDLRCPKDGEIIESSQDECEKPVTGDLNIYQVISLSQAKKIINNNIDRYIKALEYALKESKENSNLSEEGKINKEILNELKELKNKNLVGRQKENKSKDSDRLKEIKTDYNLDQIIDSTDIENLFAEIKKAAVNHLMVYQFELLVNKILCITESKKEETAIEKYRKVILLELKDWIMSECYNDCKWNNMTIKKMKMKPLGKEKVFRYDLLFALIQQATAGAYYKEHENVK